MSVYYMHFTQLAACFLHFCLSLPTPHHSPLTPPLPTYTSVPFSPTPPCLIPYFVLKQHDP